MSIPGGEKICSVHDNVVAAAGALFADRPVLLPVRSGLSEDAGVLPLVSDCRSPDQREHGLWS